MIVREHPAATLGVAGTAAFLLLPGITSINFWASPRKSIGVTMVKILDARMQECLYDSFMEGF